MADWLTYSNRGAIRDKELSGRLRDALEKVASAMGVTVEVFSGGQDARGSGGRRTGSTRHDHGNAADVYFSKDGRRLDWANPNDLPVFREIVQRAKAAGITGIGAGPGYMRQGSMHLGFGKPMTWGAGGRSKNAPGWLREAFGAPVSRPQLPITPVDAPLPSPRPPSPLQSAPVSAVQRAPLGPAVPRQMTPRGSLPGAPPTDRAPIQPSVPMPSARPQPAIDPQKLAAAYQEYAASRMAAPLNPVQSPVQAAPMMPAQPAAPPLGPPRTITPRPVFNLPPEQFPSAPSIPSQPRDPFGNTWQDGPMGRAVTNRFGVTTMQRPDGTTAAMGGPFANMDTSKLGGMAKTGLGGGLGAMLGGSLAGPLGALAGGFMGRELANGRNPMSGGGGFLGGLFGGNRDPWAGTRESSGRTTSASSSRSSTSSGSKRDSRDRPDMR